MTLVRLDQFSNRSYKPGNLMKRSIWFLVGSIYLESNFPWPYGLKRAIARAFGAHIGKKVVIKPRVRIKYPWKLKVGDYSWIGEDVWIDNLDEVNIGHHCCLSQGAFLLCGNHDYKSPTFDLMTGPIIMEDGSWLGAKALLGPGSVLGTEAVLTAGSIGLGKLEGGMVHQGNPAKPVRPRGLKA